MADTARGEIIFFSMEGDNAVIREHVRGRGRAVVLRETRQGDMITIIEHRRETSLLLTSQIPATFDGRLRVNVANAMAAAAAALGNDVQLEYIRQALRTFTASFYQTPGRFNLLEVQGRRILMDYCHNVAGLESMADFVKRMDATRNVAVISMPGDRKDEDIRSFGRLAGQVFDELVLREDSKTRGRPRGTIAAILNEAAIEGGLAPEKISIVLDEFDAVRDAVNRVDRDEFLVLMIDKPAKVWDELMNLTGARAVV
jgi:cyanophycin synthetase